MRQLSPGEVPCNGMFNGELVYVAGYNKETETFCVVTGGVWEEHPTGGWEEIVAPDERAGG